MYTLYKQIADFSQCYKTAKKMNGLPTGIVIHSTGAANPNLGRWVYRGRNENIQINPNVNYFGGKYNPDVVPHAVAGQCVDGTIAIAQILPYNVMCWGCGSGKNGSYNRDHIQIEIAEDYDNSPFYFTNIISVVTEWCADLVLEFGIEIDDIVGHAEAHKAGYASNHGDPEPYFNRCCRGFTMDDFRRMVNDIVIEKRGNKPPTDANVKYTVQVGAFSNYDNAKKFAEKVRNAGFECFVKKIDE